MLGGGEGGRGSVGCRILGQMCEGMRESWGEVWGGILGRTLFAVGSDSTRETVD